MQHHHADRVADRQTVRRMYGFTIARMASEKALHM